MNCFQNRTNSFIIISGARIELNQNVKMFQIVDIYIYLIDTDIRKSIKT